MNKLLKLPSVDAKTFSASGLADENQKNALAEDIFNTALDFLMDEICYEVHRHYKLFGNSSNDKHDSSCTCPRCCFCGFPSTVGAYGSLGHRKVEDLRWNVESMSLGSSSWSQGNSGKPSERSSNGTDRTTSGTDIYGNKIPKVCEEVFQCEDCGRSVSASRFAAHLEKDFSKGRTSSRAASLRIANAANGVLDDDDTSFDPSISSPERGARSRH